MSKLRLGIIFGGRSTEHDVSITSATTIARGLDPERYTTVLVGIDPEGMWHVAQPETDLRPEDVFRGTAGRSSVPFLDGSLDLDLVFPIVHGRGGEDGLLQGLLETAGLPYVGAGVACAALCMDKTLSKQVLREAGLPVVPSLEAESARLLHDSSGFIKSIEDAFNYPVFVKPTHTGSSVGVHKSRNQEELRKALGDAARYDFYVLAEPALDVREIECAVLGNRTPRASVLGEIETTADFYDYEAKYASDQTRLRIPAVLPETQAARIRDLALEAFRVTRGRGMVRVDFFVERHGERIFLNELNTHPGFTKGSMYPLLWQASGLALSQLLDQLVELALDQHQAQSRLEIRFSC